MSPVRAIPTSRAYWELRAEQVLNRVFNPEAPIDVEICETPEDPADGSTATGPAARAARQGPPPRRAAGPWRGNRSGRAGGGGNATAQPGLLMAGAGLLFAGTSAFGLLGLLLWQQGQQALRQERNLLMVERLRAMGPVVAGSPGVPGVAAPQAQSLPGPTAAAADGGEEAADGAGLPPPPTEPWMEELASLPASPARSAPVLRVPINRRVTSPAPAAAARGGGAAPVPAPAPAKADLPQLVGVVQVPGRPGSAIFQVNGSSTSAAAGESIGGSGWRLQSANGDTAVIERDGVQRRISISSGL